MCATIIVGVLTFHYSSVNSYCVQKLDYCVHCTVVMHMLCVKYVHVQCTGFGATASCSLHLVYIMYVACCLYLYMESYHLSISFSQHLQEAEQPLEAWVYDIPTFSKPTSVKQVMDMPIYSDVFQSKVNIMHLNVHVYKPTNKCHSGLEQRFCTYIFCQI